MKKLFFVFIFVLSISVTVTAQTSNPFAANNAFTQYDSSYITKLKKFNLNTPNNLINIGVPSTQILMSMGFGAPGYLYIIYCNQSFNYWLYRIDTLNAAVTQISTTPITLSPSINRGLSWDRITNTMYSIFSNGLYKVNLTTGVFTFVVTVSGNYLVAFAINNAGSMFGIGGGKLVRINKTSGASTEIGSLNVSDVNAIGCDFDPITGKMYLMNPNGSNTDIYLVDTVSGAATLSGTIQGSASWIAIGGRTFVGIKPLGNVIPSEFSLQQNYPNPFNPETKIRFQVASSEFVNLTVYDLLGKEIAALVNEKLSPGNYEVEWNASGYPGGTYFYRLITDNFSDTKKMVLLK